ncbi:hypothetical protein BFW38_10065 [Terasakiispira papahanaumokuakeensis]|uniref:DUF7683 domain-containing protein n=1 Tax=Terasakiispira papahanaumokuakeensis TaxID=197479 RepID=A0A1E2VA40_9GAMM|nr:hypothetical protein BFW38_10065 [Terasakiispira papahanaumokuakeensis]
MIDQEFSVRRFVTEYSNETETLLADYELVAFNLEAFQSALGVSSEDPMFDCYEIGPHHVVFLTQCLAIMPAWDFSRRSYYIEASAV